MRRIQPYTVLICIATLMTMGMIVSGCSTANKKTVTFTELDDPTADTLSDWSGNKPGLNGTVLSIDIKHPRSILPNYEQTNEIILTGWKGETVSAQVLLWNSEPTRNVTCSFSEFRSSDSWFMPGIAQARFVRYVMSEEDNIQCEVREEGDFLPVLMPDMLDSLAAFDMEARQSRPVWLTFNIPSTAESGTYNATLTVDVDKENSLTFNISLQIQDRELPPASEWGYHLDFWQHPSAVARYAGVEVWSDAHFEQMQPVMEMLANAGQKVITATLNKDPWNNQCYDPYESMIVWTKNEDDNWSYDYTVFDRWVEFMIKLGIDKMINCYSLLPWNNEIQYVDAEDNTIHTVTADPGSDTFEEYWAPFLSDFVQHLNEKGWTEITNIAMDERSPETIEAAVALLNRVAPELGISLADNHMSYQEYPLIKDICVKVNAKVDEADIQFRRDNGLITTYYVCCSDPFPNMFTFSSSAESCYSGWYSYAAGYDGFLRWAYNSWPENPEIDSRFRKFPAGDTYFVYPYARSSIRFERLIEGIQDVEKIKILKKELESENSPEANEKLNLLNETVQKFNVIGMPDSPIETLLRQAKEVVNHLSE